MPDEEIGSRLLRHPAFWPGCGVLVLAVGGWFFLVEDWGRPPASEIYPIGIAAPMAPSGLGIPRRPEEGGSSASRPGRGEDPGRPSYLEMILQDASLAPPATTPSPAEVEDSDRVQEEEFDLPGEGGEVSGGWGAKGRPGRAGDPLVAANEKKERLKGLSGVFPGAGGANPSHAAAGPAGQAGSIAATSAPRIPETQLRGKTAAGPERAALGAKAAKSGTRLARAPVSSRTLSPAPPTKADRTGSSVLLAPGTSGAPSSAEGIRGGSAQSVGAARPGPGGGGAGGTLLKEGGETKEDCGARGGAWDSKQRRCDTSKADRAECESRLGHVWQDDIKRCLQDKEAVVSEEQCEMKGGTWFPATKVCGCPGGGWNKESRCVKEEASRDPDRCVVRSRQRPPADSPYCVRILCVGTRVCDIPNRGLHCNAKLGEEISCRNVPLTTDKCTTDPEKCSPVCGENGVSYCSACHAKRQGVAVKHRGKCKTR